MSFAFPRVKRVARQQLLYDAKGRPFFSPTLTSCSFRLISGDMADDSYAREEEGIEEEELDETVSSC